MLALLLSIATAVTAAPTPAVGKTAAQCPTVAAALPDRLSVWRNAPGSGESLQLDQPADMVLTKMAAPESGYGGSRSLTVTKAGTYRLMLSDPAWIEVLAGTRAVRSSGHEHGPACSGIRKIVSFSLEAGTYQVQVQKSPAAQVRILVANN